MSSAPGNYPHTSAAAGKRSTLEALRASYGSKELEDRADSYISRFIYRPLSFYMTVPFVWMGWSANQVTLLRAAVALSSALLVLAKSRYFIAAGGCLYALCVLLDYVDGNLARLYRTAGSFGALLEELADQVGPTFFPLAVGLGLYLRPDHLLSSLRLGNSVGMLLIGALTSVSYCLSTTVLLYIRLIAAKAVGGECVARQSSSGGHSGANQKAELFVSIIKETAYLAPVVGVVLAAALDFMSIYLLARCLRNMVYLVVATRRLAARLAALRSDTRC